MTKSGTSIVGPYLYPVPSLVPEAGLCSGVMCNK